HLGQRGRHVPLATDAQGRTPGGLPAAPRRAGHRGRRAHVRRLLEPAPALCREDARNVLAGPLGRAGRVHASVVPALHLLFLLAGRNDGATAAGHPVPAVRGLAAMALAAPGACPHGAPLPPGLDGYRTTSLVGRLVLALPARL